MYYIQIEQIVMKFQQPSHQLYVIVHFGNSIYYILKYFKEYMSV